jgi:osmotically-inducible protein OsmY
MHQNDQQLQTTIIKELRYDPGIDAARITVSVGNGAVTLSGEVANLSEKLAANRSAMRIRGVTAVADEMTVRNPGNTDAEIADGASNMLKWAADVPQDTVKADVRNHVITLSGSVAWHYQRDAAARAVANMRGVTAVANQIVLDQPESTTPAHKAIDAALQRNALLDPQTIKADVEGHELVLRGTVRSFAEYRQAEQTAWAAAGVTSVRNELIVTS